MQISNQSYDEQLVSFFSLIKKDRPIIALDIGAKKIGIAKSDNSLLIASPHSMYKRRNMRQDIGEISSMCKDQDVGGVVIGFPGDPENCEYAETAAMILSFVKKLASKLTYIDFEIPLAFCDESCTTMIANAALCKMGVGSAKANEMDDKVSAAIFLQEFLNHKPAL